MTFEPMIKKNSAFMILGIGERCEKLVEDFRFVFGKLLNLGDTIVKKENFAELAEKKENYICCTYDREWAGKELGYAGLTYKKDYLFAEDFFSLLDDWKGCRVAYKSYPGTLKGWIRAIVFGYAAKHGKVLPGDRHRMVLRGHYEEHAADGRKKGLFLTSMAKKRFYLACFLGGLAEMLSQISARRKDYKKYDYICFDAVGDALRFRKAHPSIEKKVITVDELRAHTMASLYMKAVYFDRRQNGCHCDVPFRKLWIGTAGMSRMCDCPDFLEVGFGNAGVTDLEDIWNSPLAKIIRLSVINRTYTFCARELCGLLKSNKDQKELLARMDRAEEKEGPRTLLVANDNVCNLHCPSCRKVIHAKNTEEEQMVAEAATEALIASGWPDRADELVLGGSGEVFLSANYKSFLYSGAGVRKDILLMTNGTLFTPKEWTRLEVHYEHIRFSVSVDAATEETYKKVRCGGSFQRLMENMQFLSQLRREQKVDYVAANIIVQRANYREIPDFIRWVKKMGFDSAVLSHIRNWGTYTEEVFEREVSMFDADGKMKPDLAKVLEDPICQDPVVCRKWEDGK